MSIEFKPNNSGVQQEDKNDTSKERFIKNVNPEIAEDIGLAFISKNEDDHKLSLDLLRIFFNSSNLPYGEMIWAWKSNAKPGEYKDGGKKHAYLEEEAARDLALLIKKNLECIKSIETIHPGISLYLYNNFGIRNFGRFSPEMWIAQYEQRENDEPYGMVVISRDDWNSSSYTEVTYEAYNNLFKNIKPNFVLRIFESESLPELAKSLSRLKRKFKNSPEFVVWSGHFNSKEFMLGPGKYRRKNYKFSIDVHDFKGEALDRIRKYFDVFKPETVMILDGCATGNEEDLPSVAARTMGNLIIHPDGKTQVKDFGVRLNADGKLNFDVDYDFGVQTVITFGEPL